MIDDSFSPPTSEIPLYDHAFEQKDHPTHFPDPATAKKNPAVSDAHDLVEPSGNPHVLRGWGLNATYKHYEPTREPVHPRVPDLSKGNLAAGCTVTRTDVWNNRKGEEPAIMSIARFSPDNFRPVGYAENAPAPASTVSEGHLDFRHNRLPPHHADRKPFYYFVNAVTGFVAAGLIRGTVVKIVHLLWPARDVVAAGVVDVDLSPIKPGQNFIARWRGKPIFIRRRTQDMIDAALKDDALLGSMRDPEKDAGRVQKQEWLVTIGICTHLGCIPYPDQGLYGGYFCPCHGSHYDHSGRIRLGPATSNLKVPEYRFLDDNTIRLGS
jgi:ubiquinol-cytochrome c reductase iron-sulfur subunit